MSSESKLLVKHQEKLKALCTLSDMHKPLDFGYLASFIQQAPDPETAIQGIMREIPPASAVLAEKWRGVITDMWSLEHPNIPLLNELPLPTTAIASPTLADVHAYVQSLSHQSARLIEEKNEWLVEPDDALRLARCLPSNAKLPLAALENEWGLVPLRRLRSLLHATRLIRPLKGHLVPVRSRMEHFSALPAKHQLYILWHADVYHLDWSEYAGLWEPYAHIVQNYIPLLWEAVADASAGKVGDRATFARAILNTFAPFWDEEGLLDIRPGHTAALNVVQQYALPTVIDRFILRDLFERHGLVTISEEFGSISKFTWTTVGESIIEAELNRQLPCGNDLLDH